MTYPGEGEALALQRRLPSPADRLAFYAALTDNGRRKDSMLLERSVGPSFLMEKAAVRAECRGQEVTLTALSENGELALADIARRLPDRIEMSAPDRLVLSFPRFEGADAEDRLLAPSPFDALRALSLGFANASKEEPFAVTCLGIVAFDHTDLFETLPPPMEDRLDFPDYIFWLAESLIVLEPGAQPRLICTAFGSADPQKAKRSYFAAAERLAALVAASECAAVTSLPEPPRLSSAEGASVDLDDEAYAAVVTKLRGHIAAGDVYQIVPSRTFSAPCPAPILSYGRLRKLDPSPYQFFVSAPEHILFGASPETSVRVFAEEGKSKIEVKPIAGTRRRGATPDEDDRLEAELRLDHKEAAEHMMLVDLARNDVARVSASGTRRVAKLMAVERYARVMHLVSSVTGFLRQGFDSLHALQACLNVGTLTGAPKLRATQLLRETEITKRGPYGGAIGWINGEGLMDTGVVIRSAVVKNGTAFVRAGAGVVYDSDPQGEADETRHKASAVLSTLSIGDAA